MEAAGRQSDVFAVSDEQLQTQFVLQVLNMPAERWLREIHTFRGRGEVERFSGCYKALDLLELHSPTSSGRRPPDGHIIFLGYLYYRESA